MPGGPIDPGVAAIVRVGVLLLLAAGFGGLARLAGLPGGRSGAAILGGLIAGIIAWPGVTRGLAPEAYDEVMRGATRERAEFVEELDRQRADLAALSATGVSESALDEYRAAGEERIAPLRQALRSAELAHARWASAVAIALGACAVFFAVMVRPPIVVRAGEMPDARAMLTAALAQSATAILVSAVVAAWVLRLDRAEALAIGGAVGAGSVFAHLRLRAQGEPALAAPARILAEFTFLLCTGTLALVSAAAMGPWLLPLMGAYMGGRITAGRLARRAAPPPPVEWGVLWLGVAPTVALLISSIDPSSLMDSTRATVFVVIVVLLAGSGHFLGVWIGVGMRGSSGLRAHSLLLWIESHGLGVSLTQMLLLMTLVASGLVRPSEPAGSAVVAGLVLGALSFELTIGLLRRMAAAI
ncbi:MAG: hypothetical protein H6811_05100 [Phycisphaeraceae bacterium]|nr:hypothetical protein [Phycisphaeraceae bacterium]